MANGAGRVWRSTDQDGVTNAGALHALSEFDIAALDLMPTAVSRVLSYLSDAAL